MAPDPDNPAAELKRIREQREWTAMPDPASPAATLADDLQTGFCECGCGLPAPLARCTDRRRGHVKGQPVRFIKGHNTGSGKPRLAQSTDGLCECGCGLKAPLAPTSRGSVPPSPAA